MVILPLGISYANPADSEAAKALISRVNSHNKPNLPSDCHKEDAAQVLSPTTFFKERQHCEILTKYPLKAPEPTFTNYDDNFCNPAWTAGKPWETAAGKLLEENFNAKYNPETRQQKLREGYTVLSKSERQASLKEFEKTKAVAATSCCGSDKECLNHFAKIQLTYCDDREANKNPNIPDKCARSPGRFNIEHSSKNDFASFIVGMTNMATNRKYTSMSPEEIKYYRDLSKRMVAEGASSDLGVVVSGGIELSPYSHRGTPTSTTQIVSHELGHACSHIKRQLIVYNINDPVENSKAAADTLRYSFRNRAPTPTCSVVDNKTIEIFERITEKVPALNSKGLVACLAELAKKSSDPSSAVYVKGSCERAKLEEAHAEAMGFLTDPDLSKSMMLGRCHSHRSTFHPSSADVLTCVFQNSPKFIQKTKGLLACSLPASGSN